MGVLKGLSKNADGKVDVKLDDTAFTRDEKGLIGVKQSATGGGATKEDISDLWDFVKPFEITSFNANNKSPLVLEVGSGTKSVTLSWTYQNTEVHDVASQKVDGENVNVGTTNATKSVDALAHTTKTFTLVATTTKGLSKKKTVNVVVNHASYYGLVAADKTTLTATEITALSNKSVNTSKTMSVTLKPVNQKIAYAYPAYSDWGTLTKATESNMDGISGYSQSEVTMNGQKYYLYLQKNASNPGANVTVKFE